MGVQLLRRRRALQVIAAAVLAAGFAKSGVAGPLDSIPIDRGTKILKQGTFVVPGSSGGTDGVVSTDITVTGRGYFGVDFAVEGEKELTLMLVTEAQRSAMAAGRQLSGDPLARIAIDGTASHTTKLTRGRYYIFFLNAEPAPTQIVYRTSFQPF